MVTRGWVKDQFQGFSDFKNEERLVREKRETVGELFKCEFAQASIGERGIFGFMTPFYDAENKRLFWVSNDASKVIKKTGANYYDMTNPLEPQYAGFTTFGADELGIVDYNLRSISKFGDYLYIIVRDKTPAIPTGGIDDDGVYGALIIANASDLSVVSTTPFNAKGDDVKLYKASNGKVYMACGFQVSYIKFFTVDPNDYTSFTLRDTHYTLNWKNVEGYENNYDAGVFEHQYGQFFEHDNHVYYVSSGFSDGVHIYDVTNIETERATLYNYVLPNPLDGYKVHTFDLVIDYPYIYCTLAPNDRNKTSAESIAGVFRLDISDLENIEMEYVLMPTEDISDKVSGDWRPTSIVRWEDYLYMNNANKGITIWKLVDHMPEYVGRYQIDDVTVGEMLMIDDGILVFGDTPNGQTHPNGSNPTPEGSRLWEKDKQMYLFDVTGGIGSAKFISKAINDLVSKKYVTMEEVQELIANSNTPT